MDKIKAFQIRIPKEMWSFLKRRSAEKEMPMNVIIQKCLEKYKKSCEKKLTDNDTVVS